MSPSAGLGRSIRTTRSGTLYARCLIPEMGISLVDMGLIVDLRQEGDVVYVTLTYTAMGCPGMNMIEEDIRARLLALPGVRAVEIETVWEPVWTKARLTVEGRDALLLSGVAV